MSYETYLRMNNYYIVISYLYKKSSNNDNNTYVIDYLSNMSTEDLSNLVHYISEVDINLGEQRNTPGTNNERILSLEQDLENNTKIVGLINDVLSKRIGDRRRD